MTERCGYACRTRRASWESHQTLRCQMAAGHDGAHEWRDGAGRLVVWFADGPQQKPDETTRYRFGRALEEK